jgi:hypothetical protein
MTYGRSSVDANRVEKLYRIIIPIMMAKRFFRVLVEILAVKKCYRTLFCGFFHRRGVR